MIDSLRHLLNRQTYRPSDNTRRGDVLDRFIRWRQRRKSAEQLRSMPDFLLKDIGLCRGDIVKAKSACHEAFTLNATILLGILPTLFIEHRAPLMVQRR